MDITDKSYRWLLTLLLGSLTAIGPLSIDMYIPAFPAIAKEMAVDTGAIQITLSVYLLGAGIFQLLYGPLADRFGRRIPLLSGILIFLLGSVACAIANSVGMLTVARVVQSLGGSAGMVISRSVVRDLFDEKESARMFSELMLVMGLAPILAPTLGGQLIAIASWRMIFHFMAIFSVACLVATYCWLPETLPVERRLGAGIGAALRSFGEPLRNRQFIGYVLVVGFVSGILFSYISGSSFVFMELHGLSARQFGVVFGVNAFGFVVAAQVNRWLLGRYTAEKLLTISVTLISFLAAALLIFTATGWGGIYSIDVAILLIMMSIGFAFPNLAAAALAPFGRAAGGASALLGTVQLLLGGVAGGLVGVFHNGTAIPMGASVAICGFLAVVTLYLLTPRSPSLGGADQP